VLASRGHTGGQAARGTPAQEAGRASQQLDPTDRLPHLRDPGDPARVGLIPPRTRGIAPLN